MVFVGKNGAGAGNSQGTTTKNAPVEGGVKAAAGTGAQSGLPTCSDNGTISLTYHQVLISQFRVSSFYHELICGFP